MTDEQQRIMLGRLRDLRLYHYRKMLRCRKDEAKCVASGKTNAVKYQFTKGNFHLGAVQTLNEFFDMTDTAEKDNENDRKNLQL